ncbi:phosphate/phosphite/phosphonate ABC transporter substrate-binding protein [Benzoatithermus flavus]|uniref:PhnD/SsuA/transferrin family substrate-binding protein n=1 Tax=Benzoatithermus flavus TaxID=3108223 RepID=A0ABU8XQL1_9PROT
MRASLPMYDLPELRAATDGWWAGLAAALVRQGFAPVPAGLDRSEPIARVWHAPDLLLSQCCSRDLVTHLAGVVAPVALPSYRVPGCGPGTYRSFLVVRRDDPRSDLAAFAGAVAAINYPGSHSGFVALAHTLARHGLPERFLGRGRLTGSHRASLVAVAGGRADLAAVDCVTWALLAAADPALVGRLRILAESEPAPALPYVTAIARPEEERRRLFAALEETALAPDLAAVRARLRIAGFLPATATAFARTAAMAEAALKEPCAILG